MSYLKSTWKVDNFKFTGKESLQGTGYIDFGARWYDNIVPHFTTIDPLSELSRRFSPTVYANGNPLRFIDPDGMQAQTIYDFNGKAHTVGDDQQTNVFQAPIEDDKDKGKQDKNGNTNFNGGYKDKNGNSHYYPAMDVSMTMSDEGRDTYNKESLKETALALLPWGRVLRVLGLGRVGSFLLGRFLGSTIAKRGAIEVTEESIAKALEGSTMQTLQGKVSLPMVQRYVKMLQEGLIAPPIKVADGIIVEGNHRYIAGRLFGVEPAQVPYLVSPSQMNRAVPIQKTIVDLLDWGGY